MKTTSSSDTIHTAMKRQACRWGICLASGRLITKFVISFWLTGGEIPAWHWYLSKMKRFYLTIIKKKCHKYWIFSEKYDTNWFKKLWILKFYPGKKSGFGKTKPTLYCIVSMLTHFDTRDAKLYCVPTSLQKYMNIKRRGVELCVKNSRLA